MALPDSGNVEDFTEEEMNQLLAMEKTQLTKNQKAAIARYNFKKGKNEPIPFKGSAAAAAAPVKPEGPAGVPPAADITSMLSPEMQALAGRDPATLSKEEKIALAKAKSQAVRASASGGPSPTKPSGPSPEELAHQKALGFAHAKEIDARFGPAAQRGADASAGASSAQKAIVGWAMQTDKPSAIVAPERVLDVVRYLHMEMGFDQIRDLTGADYPPDRLEVVYNLYRHSDKAHIALKTKVPRNKEGEEMPVVPSIVSVFAGADWLEREVFDLLGIRFSGHPYMRRLMMPDGWQGHPLRKDYDSRKEQFIGLDEKGNDVVSFDPATGW